MQSSRDISPEDVVIVSPDVGGVARARAFAKKMGDAPLAIVDKRRQAHNVAKVNKKRMRVKCACVELGMCRRVSPVFCGPQRRWDYVSWVKRWVDRLVYEVYERRQGKQGKHTRVHLLSAFRRAKAGV